MNIFYYILYNLKVQHSEIRSCPTSSTLYAHNTAVKYIIWLLEKKNPTKIPEIFHFMFLLYNDFKIIKIRRKKN